MSEPNTWSDFLDDLTRTRDFIPRYHFHARVARTAAPPLFSYTLPLGEVALYQNYLIFLTRSKDKPGAGIFMKEFVRLLAEEFKTQLLLNLWVKDPEPLLLELAKGLPEGFRQPEQLAEALMSPNSVFLPLAEIQEARFSKGIPALRPHHIALTAISSPLIIFQDPATENTISTLIGQFTGKWQTEFLRELQIVATENARRHQSGPA